MECSSACPAVLRPLLDLVAQPILHSPVADSLTFIVFSYVLPYIFVFISLFYSSFVLCVARYLFL